MGDSKSVYGVVLLHQPDELLAPAFLDVEAPANIGQALDQFFGRRVAIDPRQGGVGHQVASLGCGLEYAFHQVVEDAVVLLLGFEQGHVHAVPLDGIADRAFQPGRRELALDQVILRSRMHGFECDDLIIASPAAMMGSCGACGFDQENVGQPGAIRHTDIEEDGVECVCLQLRQAAAQVRRRPRFGGQIPGLAQHLAHVAGERGVMLNEQDLQ